ncbi:MAG: secretin N-terminal domain-containing protein, partial [Rubripirellula sp.]|nr:secretin N-terminal domain-containing protein [Rubripirellula sp.]
QLRMIGESGMLVMDTAPRVARIRQLFDELSRQTQTPTDTAIPVAPNQVSQSGIAYFSPQYTSAEEMSEPLQLALGDQVIVAAYPTENRILVKGNENDLRLASDAVRQLDQPRPQVRITAMIYDVSLSELERLGINWSRDLRVNANTQNPALEDLTTTINELFRFNADLASSGAASVGIGTIKDSMAASAFLEALDNTTEAKLLADPSITVTDRRQASIKIVREIPIVGSNPVEGSNAVFTQTEFKEAGVILQVQPRISQDQTIELSVQPEYSVVAEITSTGPVIDSRTADTTVRVPNGQIFVLGGLRQKSIVETVRGIPYLKDLKYVGKLFRSHDTDLRESELIVFLKPEIVYPCTAVKPREQAASIVAEQQLNRIPHAEDVPQTPCCKDPNCPHHHPRPRINGGSESLYYQSDSFNPTREMQEFEGVEIIAPNSSSIDKESLQPAPENSFPHLHVDSPLTNQP